MRNEDASPLTTLDHALQGHRDRRISSYLDPQLVHDAREYIRKGDNEYGGVSALVDTAIRRQVLHDLQRSPEYSSLLEDVPMLPGALATRVPSPKNATLSSETSSTSTLGGPANRRKEIVSGRTNGGIYQLMMVLIDDPNLPYESESDFVTAGIRRLLLE